MSTRLYHIDNAKAIGMMLIVASHIMPLTIVTESQFYKTWCGILASFYVPLFFILSGVFEPSTSDFESIKRRMFKLIKYCVIFYVFGSLTYLSMFGTISWTGIRTQIGTVWFLFVLLWMTGIVGLLKHKKYSLLAFILLSMGGGNSFILQQKHLSIGTSTPLPSFLFVWLLCKGILEKSAFQL